MNSVAATYLSSREACPSIPTYIHCAISSVHSAYTNDNTENKHRIEIPVIEHGYFKSSI